MDEMDLIEAQRMSGDEEDEARMKQEVEEEYWSLRYRELQNERIDEKGWVN